MDSFFTYAEKMKIIFNKNIGSPNLKELGLRN